MIHVGICVPNVALGLRLLVDINEVVKKTEADAVCNVVRDYAITTSLYSHSLSAGEQVQSAVRKSRIIACKLK